ncbi:TonB-dependent receptor plug domain-containing protein [Candidatus Dependentiae bacterium]|nr:TonB-dependent receptor plug domain-containing protein [Candidatus Dependentiae bacterium]
MFLKKFFVFILIFVFNTLAVVASDISYDDSSEEAFFKMEEQIVVSASKRAQKLSEASVAISVISAEEIKVSGCQSIAEVLRMVPGVYVQETTGGQQDVAIRGMINVPKQAGALAVYSRNILVMIDGRSYFNDIFGGTFWEFLPVTVDDIERIEVVRGPSSALFGANAVTGVINIITKDFQNTKEFGFTASLGINNSYKNSIKVSDSFKKFAFRLTAEMNKKSTEDNFSYDHTNHIYKYRESILASSGLSNADYKGVNDEALENYKVSFFSRYLINDNKKMTMQIGHSKGKANMAGTSGDLLLVGYDNLENNVVKFTYYNNDLKIALSNIWGQLGTIYENPLYTEIKPDKYTGAAFTEITDGDEQDGMSWNSLDLDVQNIFNINDKDILVAGIEWRKSESRSDDVYFRDYQEKSQKFIAAFFNNEYKFSDKVKWVLGTRYDKFDTPDKARLSPQTILFYTPKENQTYRLIYSQAIRAPFIADLFTNAQMSDGITADNRLAPIIRLLPNENLNPMTIKSVELGYSTVLMKKINFDANLYHYRTKDVIGYSLNVSDSPAAVALHSDFNTSSGVDLQTVNLDGTFKSTGLELSMSYNPSKDYKVWSNYSYQNSKFQDKTTKAAPQHLASLGVTRYMKNGWVFSASGNFVSSSEVTLTNIMDQTLLQTITAAGNNNTLISERAVGKPYSNVYNSYIVTSSAAFSSISPLAVGFYNAMGADVAGLNKNEAAFFGFYTQNAALLTGYKAFLMAPVGFGGAGMTSAQADAQINADKINAQQSARAGFGSALAASSQNESTESVASYIFFNFRVAKKIMKDNGEIAFSASIRPDRREYAFGEKTDNKFKVSFSYKY